MVIQWVTVTFCTAKTVGGSEPTSDGNDIIQMCEKKLDISVCELLTSIILSLFINQAYSKYKHSLTFRIRRYVVIATKPVHRLQIRPIVHN